MTDDQRDEAATGTGSAADNPRPENPDKDDATDEVLPPTAGDTDEDQVDEDQVDEQAAASTAEAATAEAATADAGAPASPAPAASTGTPPTTGVVPAARVRTPARSAAAPAPTPSELAVHIDDRISAAFVVVSIAVFTLILLNGLLLGAGGAISSVPTPEPSPSATASLTASASPVAS